MFDETKYGFIQAIVALEIENFLTKDEQGEITWEIDDEGISTITGLSIDKINSI